MKQSPVSHLALLLLPIAIIGAEMFPLAVRAGAQQGVRVDANPKSEVRTAATPEPEKAGTPEPITARPPTAKDKGTGKEQQPAKQPEDKKKASEQANDTPDKSQPPTQYSWKAFGIAALMIALLGGLFWAQLYYSNRLGQTNYLGEIYQESVFQFEYTRLAAKHINDWSKGRYHREAYQRKPPILIDESVQKLDYTLTYGRLAYWREGVIDRLLGGGGTIDEYDNSRPGGITPRPRPTPMPGSPDLAEEEIDRDQKERQDRLWTEFEPKRVEFQQKFQRWAQEIREEARTKYEQELEGDRQKAKDRAIQAINSTETSFLAGQGPQFVLEFTAIIVIIFSAVILGVLGRLGEEQIGTLLAAIAGYVLGKATATRAGTGEGKQVAKT